MRSSAIKTGLDRLQLDGYALLRGRKLGLLAHPASIDGRLCHAVNLLLAESSLDIRCLFGPQHGLRGETQDNMIEWRGFTDQASGLVVHSLYGRHRRPTPDMLGGIDTLVIDMQDVGARYYTFAWTMLLCLEACADLDKQVVVLDRPNPIGGRVREGAVLDMEYRSFVGMAPIPMRHGLTMGELARYFCSHFDLDVDLQVVWMDGWYRSMWFDETGLPWVMPSPNMPTLETAAVYPGFCLLEGTELSEGRGTTRPFEIFGAPFLDPQRLVRRLNEWKLPGCVFRPLHFVPTFHKFADDLCGGAQLHVTDRRNFRSVLAATAVLAAVYELWPRQFRWKQPPYEYEYEKLPIDVLAGGPHLREQIEAGRSPWYLAEEWEADLVDFSDSIREFQHYE